MQRTLWRLFPKSAFFGIQWGANRTKLTEEYYPAWSYCPRYGSNSCKHLPSLSVACSRASNKSVFTSENLSKGSPS